MKMALKRTTLAFAVLFGTGSTAHAAITIYTTEASYLAAISSPGVDTFEDFNISGSTPSPVVRAAGIYGYTADTAPAGTFFGAGSTTDRWLSTNTATDTVTFGAFTGGVSGLGGFFFGSDVAGLFKAGSVTVSATDADGTVTQNIVGATTSSFLGFVSSGPLFSASVSAVQPSSGFLWPTINNLTLGSVSAVPEPSTWAMMLLGFGFIGWSIRSAKRRQTLSVYA